MRDAVQSFRDDRLAELKRKLAARRGKPEYAENVKAIEAEIARLEAK